MKAVYLIIGIVAVLLGLLWVFQGLGVITGGFMSGNKVFFGIGLLLVIGGIASLYSGARRKSTAKR
jgi:hypothetical protein